MKPMKSKNLFVVIVVLVVGLFIGDHLFLHNRNIASVTGAVTTISGKTYFDLTEVPESEFNVGFKTALVSGLSVEKTATTMGLSWGQFMVKNESGGKVYACDKYPFLEMELKAEGVAHSGEIPSLIIRGPCMTSDDGKKILALPLPLAHLLERLSAQPEVKVNLGSSREGFQGEGSKGEGFTISAKNLFRPGPRYWNVTGLKLYNDHESLVLDGYEMISLLDQALTLDFAVAE